jgi:23S rRNA-/tRNA-specific pseudouridylate synthase
LHRQFRERTVKKTYLCIVDGCPELDDFTVDAAIGTCEDSALTRVIDGDDSKPSLTRFTVESRSKDARISLLRAQPLTGRCLNPKPLNPEILTILTPKP